MPWFHAVAERAHEIQNPIGADKVRLLGRALDLGRESRVLDLACGRGGPALILASEFGCRVVGVEKAGVFADAARERAAASGLGDRIEIHEADAAEFPIEAEAWDVALCLGATWIWNGLERTVATLSRAVRSGGYVAAGDVYLRTASAERRHFDAVTLAETVERFERAGPRVTSLIAASEDEWDAYESLHWTSLEEWLAQNPADPGADEIRAEHERWKWEYLEHTRAHVGWVILAGRKT